MAETTVQLIESEKELDWKERTGKRLGESLLLPPAEKYLLTVHATNTKNGKDTISTYTISAGTAKFKAGSVYNIKIAVGKQGNS